MPRPLRRGNVLFQRIDQFVVLLLQRVHIIVILLIQFLLFLFEFDTERVPRRTTVIIPPGEPAGDKGQAGTNPTTQETTVIEFVCFDGPETSKNKSAMMRDDDDWMIDEGRNKTKTKIALNI